MKILITYDVSGGHPEIKQAMIDKNFLDYGTANGKTYYLPNTTLWHSNLLSPKAAIDIFNEIVIELNNNLPFTKKITIERLISVEFGSWSGIEGQAHA